MSFWNKLSSNLLGIFGNDKANIEEKEITTNTETAIKAESNEKIKITEEQKVTEVQEVQEEKVEIISEIDKLKKQLPDAFNQLSSMDEYWTAIIALEAVGSSCASSDKDFSDKERKEIGKLIHNVNIDMPSDIQEKIDELYQNPLPFNKAFLLAKASKIEMSVFEELLDSIMQVDGVKFEEKVVLNAWHDFKKAA